MNIKDRKKAAKKLRKDGLWLGFLNKHDKPCNTLRKYRPGDVVYSVEGRRRAAAKYVYVGSFRTRCNIGSFLILNPNGNVVKHDNICKIAEWDDVTNQRKKYN